jgi:predicted O-methyltransferase YrrM
LLDIARSVRPVISDKPVTSGIIQAQCNKVGIKRGFFMKPHKVKQIVGYTPYMRLEQAYRITDFINEKKIKDVLELGFAHGVSTCYLAAALEEVGDGFITTIDLESKRNYNPNIEQLLEKCSFRDVVVKWYYEPTSYTWRLMRFLEQDPSLQFDFCYLDGAHSWFVDGFAFFLVDRLLRPGGWIIFDDLDWTYAMSPSLANTDWVQSMPLDEQKEPQIRKVYELLVKTHPCYGDFRVQDGWAYAHKISESVSDPAQIRQETIYEPLTLKNIILHFKQEIIRRYERWRLKSI